MSEISRVHDRGPCAGGGRRKARADAGTEFRGVCSLQGGKFGAKITEPTEKRQTWLGTFGTAEAAARAFDAAAVKMHGAAARTNFRQPVAVDDGCVPSLPTEPSGHDGRSKFRGVCRQSTGKFGARISKGRAETWLGTFGTADEAARAYDAAAVRMFGVRAITNFEQPAAIDDDGVSSLVPEPSGDWKGKAALSLVNLPPAEWQQVEYLLKDVESTHDRDMLIEAAAILRHISLAGHGDGGR
ncbi:hypothetical protein QYE76_020450 [Lolium multiflorum]|uniref:AP2/ERF domain-containing protein n=1 Tax=Lolium multiflorum TaxID=4521 RepID=A0AAD8R4U6_LOLMU|nr:hypothetical protein QYE76_020450 [Lolium multiflorum]